MTFRARYYQDKSRSCYLEIERLRERIPEHPQVFGNEVKLEQKSHRYVSSLARGALFEILRQQDVERKRAGRNQTT